MTVYINSELKVIPEDISTVGKLVDHLRISRHGTGVGLNNRLIPSSAWDNTYLKENDRIMIVSATYGG